MNTTLPKNPADLQRLYNETIDTHNAYLARLEAAFDRRCEEIKADTQNKIKAADGDAEKTKAIEATEAKQLSQTLSELKTAINQSSRNAYATLERISQKMEMGTALEKELANI